MRDKTNSAYEEDENGFIVEKKKLTNDSSEPELNDGDELEIEEGEEE